MKKFIASFILFFSVFSLSFADNFLSHRYFEIKYEDVLKYRKNAIKEQVSFHNNNKCKWFGIKLILPFE